MGALRHTVGKPSPKIPPSHWRDLIPEHADRLAGLPVPCQLPACLPELSLELPPEPAMEGAPSDHLRAMLAATGGFALLFSLADRLSRRYVRVYAGFSRAEKADWCSRCALLADWRRRMMSANGLGWWSRAGSTRRCTRSASSRDCSTRSRSSGGTRTCTHCAPPRWPPRSSPSVSDRSAPFLSRLVARLGADGTRFDASACGYFLFDLYVLIRWQVPLWRVFVIHHVVAA